MANTIGAPPTGLGWDELYPDIDDPYGNSFLEIRDLRKGVRIRLDKEHVACAVAGVGGEHKQGSAVAYAGNYSVAWPTKKPDGSTDLAAADSGRIALDTTSTPNRVAIYIHGTGWVEIGAILGSSVITGKVKLPEQAADPTNAANYGFVYTKDVSGVTELFYIDSAGTVRQITSGGKLTIVAADIADDLINDTKIRLQNNAYLTARNAAGDGDINLVKVNASNLPEILVGAVLSADTAPASNAAIANKKYVDDRITAITNATPSGTSESTGSYTFIGGFTIKYGKTSCNAGENVFTFAGLGLTAFSTACFQLLTTNATNEADAYQQNDVYALSKDGFSIRHNQGTDYVRWFAIGY